MLIQDLGVIQMLSMDGWTDKIPIIDALEGLFAGEQDIGLRQADVHSTLTLSHTL